MDTTTTTLPHTLREALKASGLPTENAAKVAALLPPAGQHVLLTDLRADPDALHALAASWIGNAANRLRTTHDTATTVRAQILPAVTR